MIVSCVERPERLGGLTAEPTDVPGQSSKGDFIGRLSIENRRKVDDNQRGESAFWVPQIDQTFSSYMAMIAGEPAVCSVGLCAVIESDNW